MSKSFLGRRFLIEYCFIKARRSSTTSCSNYSIEMVGFDTTPTKPATTSAYIAEANSFTIIIIILSSELHIHTS